MTTAVRYSPIAIWFHWIIAILIVGNAALAISLDYWPDEWVRPAVDMHKSIGITVLGLALMRILWRFAQRPPDLPPSYRQWERSASHAAHLTLYLLMIAIPLSGWMHDSAWKDAPTHPMFWFGLFTWPRIGWIESVDPLLKERLHDVFGAAHAYFGYALYALLALHILGALKHQFLDREPELQRMWGA